MNIAGDCVGVVVVQSVMCRDLAIAPGAYVAPPAAQAGAATATDEYDVSCEPYYRRDSYLTPHEQDDLSPPVCQPSAQESLPRPAQPPTPKEQASLPSPAQPSARKEQDHSLQPVQLPRPCQEDEGFKHSNQPISESMWQSHTGHQKQTSELGPIY
ncbi:uncharacterized protein LOC119384782 [Rhipicephalus sanguineus]|uniref:uncharacterized protein LOC119384782 n=1 Tax=Rhipicephalus sanguineus TaxID=34632 RepID=UPI0018949BDD|nr:uncharacterized protein LOC119384782 [Rhipicephalus sanguineus]